MQDINLQLGAALLCRIFPGYYKHDQAALSDLIQACRHNIDPFRFVAVRLSMSESEIYRRAARAVSLAFVDTIPFPSILSPPVDHTERLHDVRTMRGCIRDREILFIAPEFWHFVELTKRLTEQPCLGRQICLVAPRQLRAAYAFVQTDALYRAAIGRLTRVWPFSSAHLDLPVWVRAGFLLILFFVTAGFGLPLLVADAILIGLTLLLFLVPSIFRLFCAIGGNLVHRYDARNLLADAQLPVYSVIIPLRDEANMVRQLVHAMRSMNYPAEKLDIKFVVEATSTETIAEVRHHIDDIRFELVIVPDGEPRTKPKAMNFALPFVRGDYLVVYDAEDIPEPNQIRKAATVFAQNSDIACLQAELVIDNAHENGLTALFSAEYAVQFGLIMPTFAHFGIPMPLGGTSNHLKTTVLKAIGGWDSFNVTEDADLGIRLSRRQLKCGILDSYTREEAPVSVWAWVRQRTRWMKGWMQTLLVHSRDFRQFSTQLNAVNLAIFYIYITSMVFAAPLHTLFMAGLITDMVFRPATGDPTADIYAVVIITGYLSALASAVLGLFRTRQCDLLGWQLLLPLYWLLTSLATLRATFELATNPFSWDKTAHSVSRVPRIDRRATPEKRHLFGTLMKRNN